MTDEPERRSAIDLTADEFRAAGHALVDDIADFFASLPERRITRNHSAQEIRNQLPDGELPRDGTPANELLAEVAPLVFEHSLHNGHPNFLGYITSSAAPLGALGDLLAAAVNANVGKWDLSPAASEIEAQTIRWLGDMVGYAPGADGLMVSGGNMANFVGFVAARCARSPWDIRARGVGGDSRRLVAYCSRETHTWIEKAADVTGIGTEALRWIPTDTEQRIRIDALSDALEKDANEGNVPFLIVGTAGSVSTGAVDDLPELHRLAERHDAWLHVDGAYGAPAATVAGVDSNLTALALADSVALDPHKWLYTPIEAACTLVRDGQTLLNAFSYRPPYYRTDGDEYADQQAHDYYEYGMQNSRGFRALKVWLCLRHLGRDGYRALIAGDIELARQLYDAAREHRELQAMTHNLSITTFRYVPDGIDPDDPAHAAELNRVNEALVARLQTGGELYVSNAMLGDTYVLRACVVNFRTTSAHIARIPEIVTRLGREEYARLTA